MKVQQQFASWVHDTPTTSSSAFCCKRLRPLAPKLTGGDTTTSPALDLRSFIKPETNSNSKNVSGGGNERRESGQVEAQTGGTRWNPTQEQIGILEMLYRRGMRTPNAQQIEHITVQLSKYGKIEGKNVFYWFQNHKARERQKQKRNSLRLGSPTSCKIDQNPPLSPASPSDVKGGSEKDDDSYFKRKCRSWAVQSLELESRICSSTYEDKTLELFPLHPESR